MPVVSSLFGRFSETANADDDDVASIDGDEQAAGERGERSGQKRARSQQRRQRRAKRRRSFTVLGALRELGRGLLEIVLPGHKNKVNDAVTSLLRQNRLARQQRAQRAQRTTRRNSLVGRNNLRASVEAASSKEGMGSPPGSPTPPAHPEEIQPGKQTMFFQLWCTLFYSLENDIIREGRRVGCLDSIYQQHREKDEAALLEVARCPDTTEMALDVNRKPQRQWLVVSLRAPDDEGVWLVAAGSAAIALNSQERGEEGQGGGGAGEGEVVDDPIPERLRKCSTTATTGASTPEGEGDIREGAGGPGPRTLGSILGGGGGGAGRKPRLSNLAAKLKGAAQQERKEMEACTVSETTLAYLDVLSSTKGLGLDVDGSGFDERAVRRAVFVLLRRRVWITMTDPESSPLAYLISFLVLFLIMVSSVTFCMETLEKFDNPDDAAAFRLVETVCIIAFTLEYSIKFLTAEERMAFVKAPLNLVDLVSILPYYLEEVATSLNVSGTRILRVVRLVRVFRILKLGGRFGKIQVVWKAMTDSMDMLGMMLFLVVLSIIVFSTLIYFAERGYYDEALGYHTRKERTDLENPFRSIPESFWWTMVTLMTVGYGDQFPVTIWGKLVASMAMIVSVLILALPISVIGTNFTQQWMNYKEAGRDRSSAHKMAPEFVRLHEWLQEHNATLSDLYQKIRDVEHEMDDLIFAIKDKIRLKRRQIDEEKKYNARKVMIMRKVQSMKRRSDAPAGGTFDAAGPRSALLRHTTSSASNVAAQWMVKRRRQSAEDKAAEERRKQEEAIERGAREMSDIDVLNRKLALQKERLQEMLIVAEIMSGNNFPRAGYNFSRMLDDCRARYKEMDLVADESVALCMEAEGLQERVQSQEDELLYKQAGVHMGGKGAAADETLLDD